MLIVVILVRDGGADLLVRSAGVKGRRRNRDACDNLLLNLGVPHYSPPMPAPDAGKGSSGGQLSRSGMHVVPMPRLTYAGPILLCGYQPATNRGPAPWRYVGRKGEAHLSPCVRPARQSAKDTVGPRVQSKTSGAWDR